MAVGAVAENTISHYIEVIGYNTYVDYMGKILTAVDDGSVYALEMASIYERQRNMKIEDSGSEYEQTSFFEFEKPLEDIRAEIAIYMSPEPEVRYPLTDYERSIIEKAIMGEARGEPYEGQMMIAQCILDGAERNNLDIATSMGKYQIYSINMTATDSVREAVAAVFDRGERVTEEKADLWYAYNTIYSGWHESQQYICTIGNHKFFWCNKNIT